MLATDEHGPDRFGGQRLQAVQLAEQLDQGLMGLGAGPHAQAAAFG